MFSGKMIIISAPSGAGKTTLVKHLLEVNRALKFSVSCTTRKKRDKETEGKDYYFISTEEFKHKIEHNLFAEWEEVYPDLFYGTLRTEIDQLWEQKFHIAFDIDVQGGINLKNQYQEKALSIFIQPPTIEELENRLRKRNTESEEVLNTRIQKAAAELGLSSRFDKCILNDSLELAKKEMEQLVYDFLLPENTK